MVAYLILISADLESACIQASDNSCPLCRSHFQMWEEANLRLAESTRRQHNLQLTAHFCSEHLPPINCDLATLARPFNQRRCLGAVREINDDGAGIKFVECKWQKIAFPAYRRCVHDKIEAARTEFRQRQEWKPQQLDGMHAS